MKTLLTLRVSRVKKRISLCFFRISKKNENIRRVVYPPLSICEINLKSTISWVTVLGQSSYMFIYLVHQLKKNATPTIISRSFRYGKRSFPHLACARLGDMAILGDMATINIFVKKWSCI